MDVQEIHQLAASRTPLTGNLACNPGMCPDWESNQQPFGLQPAFNPLSYTSQGYLFDFLSYLRVFQHLLSPSILIYYQWIIGNQLVSSPLIQSIT